MSDPAVVIFADCQDHYWVHDRIPPAAYFGPIASEVRAVELAEAIRLRIQGDFLMREASLEEHAAFLLGLRAGARVTEKIQKLCRDDETFAMYPFIPGGVTLHRTPWTFNLEDET